MQIQDKKLQLSSETLATISQESLALVAGGATVWSAAYQGGPNHTCNYCQV